MITQKETKGLILWFKTVSVFLALLTFGLVPVFAHAFDVFLGTGEAGTFSHFTGRLLTRVINRHAEDINCTTVPGAGDMHNLTNLLQGSLDVALVDSRMLSDAVNKSGYFKFLDIQYDNLRTLVSLYDVPITLIVRKDANITSLNKLKGKRINAGAPRSPEHLAVDTILSAKNWSGKDFALIDELSPSQSQDTMSFCHGTVQAMVHIGVHPDASLGQLFRLCNAQMVGMNDSDIEKLVSSQPAFFNLNVAPDTYPSQPEQVATFGTRTLLVVSKDLDEQTVHAIISAIFNNRERLKTAHPAMGSIGLAAIGKGLGRVKPHAAAVRFLSEQ